MSSENPSIRSQKLDAAIACLDLSLESELALYRHRLSQETVALAALPSAESEALGFPADADTALADQGIATIETDDEDETLPESYSAELTAQPKAFDQFLDPSINDYLQSSETLLKHLNQPAEADSAVAEAASISPKRSWVEIVGMALLVLGLLALGGFLVMLAARWFSMQSAKPNAQTEIQPSPLPSLSSSPLPTASLSPLPNPAIAPPQSSAAATGSPQPSTSAVSGTVPATEGVPPTPSPAPASASPINPNASRYIVLAVANSSESLQTAQRLVPDAYVTEVEGQQRIQLASLDSLQQAQQMVNELKNQGFPAAIVAQN
jgi:hypothetical protein